MALQDASEMQEAAVRATLHELKLANSDEAAKQLAIRYAKLIDASVADPKLNAWALRWIGPLLLDVLGELGATPAARASMKTGQPADARPSKLAAFRANSA